MSSLTTAQPPGPDVPAQRDCLWSAGLSQGLSSERKSIHGTSSPWSLTASPQASPGIHDLRLLKVTDDRTITV